jgi:penicillin-binding protein 1C
VSCALCLLALIFAVLDRLYPFPIERLTPPASTAVLGAGGEPLRFFLARDHAWRFPVSLDEVAGVYLEAVIASEDRRFYAHPGIDPASLARAMASNAMAGRVVRGGSTITMQVARLAEPKPRTVAAKAVECFRALQLELRFTKREILKYYVNLAPFGGNIAGIGAASWFYFGKTPDKLSLAEAALLASVPRAPNRLNPVRHPEEARRARHVTLGSMAAVGAAGADQVAEAREQPLPGAFKRPPLVGPHLAQMALAASPPGQGGVVRTTLDPRIQELARQAARSRLVELRGQGVGNAAVAVLDVKTRAVLALVGSDDYQDMSRKGRINAALANRSPGSALKPFLYALAFQDGAIGPESLILDIPITLGGYDPHNYDGSYRGRVEARDALVNSFNTPAVRLLAEAGPERFHALLLAGGLKGLSRPTAHYGLSLILGGGEVSLLDLTNLYATLARGGMHGPPRFLDRPAAPETRLISPEASWLVTDILTGLERPDIPGGTDRAMGVPAVAWKTGTSFGHRDAFAVGFSSRFAVGVWAGNVDGRAVKGISGARQAAPLLFDVFRAIEPAGSGLPRPEGLRLDQAEVCFESRQLAGPDCPRSTRLTVIEGVTRLQGCPVHKRVLVDAATGLRIGGGCLEGRIARQEVIADHPAELVAWWRISGVSVPAVPEISPDCPEMLAGQPPRITSPRKDAVYRLREGAPAEYQRVGASARAAAGAGSLTWFLDGRVAGVSGPGETMFLEMTPGSHRIVVVDAMGRSDAARYLVE